MKSFNDRARQLLRDHDHYDYMAEGKECLDEILEALAPLAEEHERIKSERETLAHLVETLDCHPREEVRWPASPGHCVHGYAFAGSDPIPEEVRVVVELSAPRKALRAARDGIEAQLWSRLIPLCEDYGYGAVMDLASRVWASKEPYGEGGAHTVGACRDTVRAAMKALGMKVAP